MINAAEKDFIGAEWGKERLDLVDMVVHADYHRHGAGKALMEYGLNIARERHVPITLTASFLGHFLYLHMGFQELGYVECGEEGDDEKIGMWVMVWTPEGWEKPQA